MPGDLHTSRIVYRCELFIFNIQTIPISILSLVLVIITLTTIINSILHPLVYVTPLILTTTSFLLQSTTSPLLFSPFFAI